jgi:hypothetical protein
MYRAAGGVAQTASSFRLGGSEALSGCSIDRILRESHPVHISDLSPAKET